MVNFTDNYQGSKKNYGFVPFIQALPLPSKLSSNLREHLNQYHIAHFNAQLLTITQLSDEAVQIQAIESLLRQHH